MTAPRTRKANAPDMSNAPDPQDHKSPAQREAEAIDTIELEFRGGKFTVPAHPDDFPVLASQAFSKNMNIDGIEHLLGPRQWALFLSKNPRKKDFDEFARQFFTSMGFGDEGN